MVMARLEFRTCRFLDKNLTFANTDQADHTDLWVRVSALLWISYGLDFVPSRIPKPQAKQCMHFHSIIMWSNDSFHHFRISTTQYLLLLSLCSLICLCNVLAGEKMF